MSFPFYLIRSTQGGITMNAVSLEHLSKTYPDGKQAVDGISIALKPGEIFGFLGPKGA